MKDPHNAHPNPSAHAHDRRHAMRKMLTPAKDLIVDINHPVSLSDLSEELSLTVKRMAVHKSSDPTFWRHAFKFLNDFKDDIHTRLWTGDQAADHQARIDRVRYASMIQLRLLIRNKTIPSSLQTALNHLFAPALSILMLRLNHDRESGAQINALQLVYEVIESYQESPASLDAHQRPPDIAIKQRVHNFFKELPSITQALSAETLIQLNGDANFERITRAARDNPTRSTASTDNMTEQASSDTSAIAPPVTLTPPVSREANHEDPLPTLEIVQATPTPAAQNSNDTGEGTTQPNQDPIPTSTPNLPDAPPSPPEEQHPHNPSNDTPVQTAIREPINPALDTLLNKISKQHLYTWFKVQLSDDTRPRRLMFANYQRDAQLVEFVNVRHELTMTLSAADFNAGLHAGLTCLVHDEAKLTQLLDDYLASTRCD